MVGEIFESGRINSDLNEMWVRYHIAILLFIFGFASIHSAYGQISSKRLSDEEIASTFTDDLKTELQINFPIYRIYEYTDNSGKNLIVMTEHEKGVLDDQVRYDTIQAFCYSVEENNYSLNWTLKDFILRGDVYSPENSIWFWTRYFELDDYSGDGLVDPIMIYGTWGPNDFDDGRIKILIYHNAKKRAIRHQNALSDWDRHTQVDVKFYELPVGIQDRVHFIMDSIEINDHAIFPYGWEKAMENGELEIDERN